MQKRSRKPTKRIAILAATICLILAGSVTAGAWKLFGLQDMVLPSAPPAPSSQTADDAVKPEIDIDLISLQGFSDSKEYQATTEWTSFTSSYDADGSLLAAVGNGPTGLSDRYSLYLVYTQEMADKLDEITQKYGLKLHTDLKFPQSKEEFYQLIGSGDFLGKYNTQASPYLYEDGTFHIDGSSILENGKTFDYQIMNCVKGSFTDVLLNIGDIQNYEEWTYETADGTTLSLAHSPDKSLIVLDTPNSFLTVNILTNMGDTPILTKEDVEQLADSFQFSLLNQQ